MRRMRWPCCARAANGKAAAPPMSAMNRRRFRSNCIRSLARWDRSATSLAEPVRALGERAHAIKAFARRDIKRLLVGAGECGVGGLARHLDGAEILTLGVEYLNAGDRGDVDAVLAFDRHAVRTAFRTRRYVAKLRARALVLERAVGRNVIGEHRRVEGVVDDQGLAVGRERQPVRSRDA